MKRISIAGVALGVCVAGCLALADPVQSPGQLMVAAVVLTLPDGQTTLTIHNNSSVSITAYALDAAATDGTNRRTTWLLDSMLASGVAPIGPANDRSVIVAQPNEHPAVTFRAALFQDGSTFGDSDWVKRLQNRRRYAAKAFTSALADLAIVAPSATSPADLAQKLNGQMEARIKAFPVATTTAQGVDLNDKVLMLRSRYPVVNSMIEGGLCSNAASMLMVDCARKVTAWTQQKYGHLIQILSTSPQAQPSAQ